MPTRRDTLLDDVMRAGRESTTAGVLLHTVVAQQIGLNATDTRSLDLLLRLGPMSAGDLSAHTGLTTASVTTLVDRLERRGLVRRERDPADRRRVVVRAEPEAATVFAERLTPFLVRLTELLADYDDDALAAIARYLRDAAGLAREEAARIGGVSRSDPS
ncbi:MAG: MarR family transcriptional regulator [Myxococcota bacterium]